MMKKLQITAVFALLVLLSACGTQHTESNKASFALLPLPRVFVTEDGSSLKAEQIKGYYLGADLELAPVVPFLKGLQRLESPEKAQLRCELDPNLETGAEGYHLDLGSAFISVKAKDEEGLFYGLMTLSQLMQDAIDQDAPLPQGHIEDWPELSYRAIHLDVKHHLDRPEYYYALIDELAGLKVNAIIIEIEDKLAYESHPLVGSKDALSKEEWRRLSDYALARHIRISPLVQGLGHASFILKHDKYRHLRDNPDVDWAFNPLAPETYTLQFDLYKDALEAFPHGRYLHVGGDEVETNGRGSGKDALALQLIWLNKVCEYAEEAGRVPIFWDDMPIKHAGLYGSMFDPDMSAEEVETLWKEKSGALQEQLSVFPKNCVYMRWNYSHAGVPGNLKAMSWFKENGFQVMGATAGQTRWVLMPQEESNMDNIRVFATACIDMNLEGLLLTLWDDDSPHFELYKRGIAAFAEYSWSGDRRSKEEIKSAYRQRAFGKEAAAEELMFVDKLEEQVAWYKNALLKGNRRNYLAKGKNQDQEGAIDLPDPAEKGAWAKRHADKLARAEEALVACDSIAMRIDEMKALSLRNTYRLEVYEQVNQLVRFSAHSLLALRDYDLAGEEDEELAEAESQLRELKQEYAHLRQNLEQVYATTRILNKPEDYILDQDHHRHLANQSIGFDWQFGAEMLFLEQLDREILQGD